MKLVTRLFIGMTVCAVGLSPAWSQEPKPQAPGAGAQAMPPMPKPGPEHAILKQEEGTWDATVEMWPAPGAPPAVSKGVETSTMGCGGLCLITDFKGDMMGSAFTGHGVSTYDGAKKKYSGVWIDSMSTGLSQMEATYDSAKKVMTGNMEGPDMTGKMMKMKSVTEYKEGGTRVFTMYNVGADGKESPGMRITYKKRS